MIKRLSIVISLLLVLCVLSSCGRPKNNNTSSSEENAQESVQNADNAADSSGSGENKKYHLPADQKGTANKVLLDKNGLTITQVGLPRFEMHTVANKEYGAIYIPVIIMNDTNDVIDAGANACYLNGVNIYKTTTTGLEPMVLFSGNFNPGEIETNICIAYLNDLGYQSMEDVKEIRLGFYIYAPGKRAAQVDDVEVVMK